MQEALEVNAELKSSRIRFGTDLENQKTAWFDLDKFVSNRALIQANSGGGKSHTTRKILEETYGKVQQIVIDPEGEFASLREKFDYVLFGKEGDFPSDVRSAETLARKLLETWASAIIDLYELGIQEKKRYVKLFLDALVNSPKELWHPVLVVLDEGHIFAPEKDQAESTEAVASLASRGRKRGFCAVICTQRPAKLSKDVSSELNNKFIGRCVQDIDRKRASDELGFRTHEQELSLRALQPGEFYVFGPAFEDYEVRKVKVGQVVTSEPKAGSKLSSRAPSPRKETLAILSKFADLPQEVQRELKDKESMLSEIRDLKAKLRSSQASQNAIDSSKLQEIRQRSFEEGARKTELELRKHFDLLQRNYSKLQLILQNISKSSASALGIEAPKIELPKPSFAPTQILREPSPQKSNSYFEENNPSREGEANDKLRTGERRMLSAAKQFYPKVVSRTQIGTLARLKPTSGTFDTYLSHLKSLGFITTNGDNSIEITKEGLARAEDIEELPTDPKEMLAFWKRKVGENSGAGRMLEVLAEIYPNSISKEELLSRSNLLPSGSSDTYLSKLRSNKLAVIEGKMVRASRALFLEEE